MLLLDKPLSNLDADLRIQMRGDILDLHRKLKLTTIFVTHDQEEANTTSDRIEVPDQGVIHLAGGRTFDIGDAVTIGLDVGQIRILPG